MNKFLKNEPFLNQANDQLKDDQLRGEVQALAEAAFHHHLISGHGDSEYPHEYQIVHQGKPMHLPLHRAYAFLAKLMQRSPQD